MRWACLLAVLVLVAPAPASALTYREQRALGVAQAKWKRLPCGGAIVMQWQPEDWLTTAQAQPPCTIVFNETVARPLIWPFFCSLVVHEVGHLLGYGHSPDPRSVMYPQPGTYWRCNHSWRWNYRR